MCLLNIAEPVFERIFEQTKHRIGIVLASELTVLSYLNASRQTPFLPSKLILENRKSLFIAEPRSDFNRSYEQQISENHNCILFIAVSL